MTGRKSIELSEDVTDEVLEDKLYGRAGTKRCHRRRAEPVMGVSVIIDRPTGEVRDAPLRKPSAREEVRSSVRSYKAAADCAAHFGIA